VLADQIYVNGIKQYFWVAAIQYNDQPGVSGQNSTATIICEDFLARAGRIYVNDWYQVQEPCTTQINLFESFYGGPLPADMTMNIDYTGLSEATASGTVAQRPYYNGTVTNRINLNMLTERGLLNNIYVSGASKLNVIGRKTVQNLICDTDLTRTSTASSNEIVYQDFNRISLGFDFINEYTVSAYSATNITAQTTTNSTSVTAYGRYSQTTTSVDATETQALGHSQWVANSMSDATSLRYQASFTDVAQTGTCFTDLLDDLANGKAVLSATYRVPGAASDTTQNVVIEGYLLQITPNQTTMTLNLSPLTYYQFFTLDSTTLGILGGTMVYDTPITYNDAGETYNAASTDNGSRLGW
jgi:hypothetical protein